MDFQISEDSAPSEFISEEQRRQLVGRPPATGAWLAGDPLGDRKFTEPFDLDLESGSVLGKARLAFESWGTLNPERTNAILVLHALACCCSHGAIVERTFCDVASVFSVCIHCMYVSLSR